MNSTISEGELSVFFVVVVLFLIPRDVTTRHTLTFTRKNSVLRNLYRSFLVCERLIRVYANEIDAHWLREASHTVVFKDGDSDSQQKLGAEGTLRFPKRALYNGVCCSVMPPNFSSRHLKLSSISSNH